MPVRKRELQVGAGRGWLASVACTLFAITSTALAEPPTSPATDEARADEEAARAHFTRGLELSREGAWEEALAELRASLALFPRRVSPALAAAVCLQNLKRYDEALELLEPLRGASAEALDPARRAALEDRIAQLSARVGTLAFEGGEPGATILIDGLYRGNLPPPAPLRVVPGSHVIRVFKEGSDPFGAVVQVVAGQTAVARLASLSTTSGRLRVTEERNRVLSVVLDGRVVGKTPWEGSVAEGEHIVELRGDDNLGTAPVSVSVAVRRVAPLKLLAEDLGATLRVEPLPAGASVAVDGVSVGRGLWEGHLRVGRHLIEVAATGFVPASREIELKRSARSVLPIALSRDPSSPFWQRPPRFLVELSTGLLLLVPSFGGDIVGRGNLGMGSVDVLRGGYELGSGLGFGLSAGALSATQTIDEHDASMKLVGLPPASRTTKDVLGLQGLLLGAWVGYSTNTRFPIHIDLGAGGLMGVASDARSGNFHGRSSTSSPIGSYVERGPAHFVFVAPELRVGWPLSKHVELEAGLSSHILFRLSAPKWNKAAPPINAGSDGYGWFEEGFVGGAVFTIAPMVGARFEL